MEFNLSLKTNYSFKRAFGLFRRSAQKEGNAPVSFNSMSPLSGLTGLSTDMAMRFTAVFAAIRLRSETVASLPKIVTEITDSGRTVAKRHPIYKLLKYKPNGFMNIFVFWEYLNSCLDGWGNAYAIIIRSTNGTPKELIPIHPSLVMVTLSGRKKWFRVVGSKYYDGIYSDDDMLHFFSLSTDGIKGINPITYNAAAIKTGISATQFGNEFFDKGGNIKAVYETDKELKGDTYKRLSEHLNSYSDFETPVLEAGLKYRTINIAPEAAQMLQTRTFALQDIARIFNVPPHLIADLSRSTFSNIEHQDIQYVKYSIRPAVKLFETELETKLFFDDEIGTFETKFNLDGLLRGDMKTRAEYYSKAIQNGWLTRNEVRELEGRNSNPELNKFLYPANMVVAGEEQNKKGGNNK